MPTNTAETERSESGSSCDTEGDPAREDKEPAKPNLILIKGPQAHPELNKDDVAQVKNYLNNAMTTLVKEHGSKKILDEIRDAKEQIEVFDWDIDRLVQEVKNTTNFTLEHMELMMRFMKILSQLRTNFPEAFEEPRPHLDKTREDHQATSMMHVGP